MKKIIALTLACLFILPLVLTSCGSTPEEPVVYDGFINNPELQKAFMDAVNDEEGNNFRAELVINYGVLGMDPLVSGALSGLASWIVGKALTKISDKFKPVDKLNVIYKEIQTLEEMRNKLDRIEHSLDSIRLQIADTAFKKALDDRHTSVIEMNNANYPTLKTILMYIDMDDTDERNKYDNEIKGLLSQWAKSNVGGNSVISQIANMMDLYGASYTSDGLTFPEIYDRYAYRIYAWEHEGYEYREECRVIDSICITDAYNLVEMYYTLNPDGLDENFCKIQLASFESKLAAYQEIIDEHQVQYHEDFLVCQLEGCRYAFYKNLKYYDYFGKGEEVFKGQVLNFEYNKNIASMTDDVFYNCSCYADPALREAFVMPGAESLDGFVKGGDLKYIPAGAYKVIYNYYNNGKTKDFKSIYQIFADLGVKGVIADNTSLVSDRTVQQYTKASASWTLMYINGFRFKEKSFSKNKDYYNVASCLNDNCSLNEDKTVAHRANYSQIAGKWKCNNYGTREKYIFIGFAIYEPALIYN